MASGLSWRDCFLFYVLEVDDLRVLVSAVLLLCFGCLTFDDASHARLHV